MTVFLYLKKYGARVSGCLEKVIGGPDYGRLCVGELRGHESAKLQTTPREHRGCKCHRTPKLDIVASIVVPTNQVYLRYHESNSHLHLFHDQKLENMKWKTRRGNHTSEEAPSERPESVLQGIR